MSQNYLLQALSTNHVIFMVGLFCPRSSVQGLIPLSGNPAETCFSSIKWLQSIFDKVSNQTYEPISMASMGTDDLCAAHTGTLELFGRVFENLAMYT